MMTVCRPLLKKLIEASTDDLTHMKKEHKGDFAKELVRVAKKEHDIKANKTFLDAQERVRATMCYGM